MSKKNILFYSVIAIFIFTAIITLLGLSQVIEVKDSYLSWLLTTLIGEIVVAVISLFKGVSFIENEERNLNPSVVPINKIAKINTPNIGNPPQKLSLKEEKIFLNTHKQWHVVETKSDENSTSRELHRVYEFKSFEAAFNFMNRAANEIVIHQDHHPRWENIYNRVDVWLTTFNINRQISNRDIKLATALEDLWTKSGKGMSST